MTSASHHGDPGALAVVFDDRRRFAAIGLWDPTSPIRVRVLHAGTPLVIDEDFWVGRLATSLDRRRELIDDPGTTAYRCVHGENDGFPGLVIDRYDEVGVAKVYSASWHPHLAPILRAFAALTGVTTIVLRHGRSIPPPAGLGEPAVVLGPHPAGPVPFLERGLRFEADVLVGQKTGHFLDQRENRVLVGGVAAGGRVLDVFCCTGGFSVHAAAGGAVSVASVDRSGPALRTTERNMALNADLRTAGSCRHRTVEGDAFDVLERLAAGGHRYDVVVVDPPSFASRATQVDRALAAYGRLTRLATAVIEPGGLLVQSSCSSRVTESAFHDIVVGTAVDAGHGVAEWVRTGHAVDHPVSFAEGRYLKTVFLRIDP